ncbi:uncharacterized protein [Dermacentor albipictus]|uniref:uncharacterized protein isoform X2 n=1 Tax=Dermacentor albipictus TaxID=60249 RepID=UPI0031FBB74B
MKRGGTEVVGRKNIAWTWNRQQAQDTWRITAEGFFHLRTLVSALSEDGSRTGLSQMCQRRLHNEQRCYDQQRFTQQELQVLRALDDKLRNGEITRVRSTYPSNVSQTEREMFKERIYSAIMSIAPNERAARIIKEKLENFVKCMANSYQRPYPGGRNQRE